MGALEKTFGANVRRLRKERGLTQEQLAFETGIAMRYIGMIERAEASATLGMVEKLANALGVPSDALLQYKL